MKQVLLFAGTVEGRKIAEFLSAHRIPTYVCVATEYGSSLLAPSDDLQVSQERLNQDEMAELMRTLKPKLVIDATHPYAAEVTANIRAAASQTGCTYQRLLRSSSGLDREHIVSVASTAEAAAWLDAHEGRALLTTGSKELAAYTGVHEYQTRLFARVLSLPKVMEQCDALGFRGANLIGMQGPFTVDMNRAMIRQLQVRYLVTKDTGNTGGYPEKYQACQEEKITMVVIGRPVQEEGLSYQVCRHLLAETFDVSPQPKIALIGIGMGQKGSMTVEADAWCQQADLIIGAARMVENYQTGSADLLQEYRADVIADYIRTHPEYERIAILLSGDVGFYSGAKKLLECLPVEAVLMPGIASLVAFCARLQVSWEDLYLTSAHGKHSNLVGCIRHNPKVFSLLGKENQVAELCRKLVAYGMDDVELAVGTRLSYADEQILRGKPQDFVDLQTDTLSVLYAYNPRAVGSVTHGFADERFLRDKVPMTKEEVREVSICKLNLSRNSIIYDIGAGSGSVSVEMADLAWEGEVYAIEKKETAVALLRKNKEHFAVDNMTIVEGIAPDAMEDLPAPTHAFIGGSSGNLKEICALLWKKNPNVRIVVNAITLETVGEALAICKELESDSEHAAPDIVSVTAAGSKKAGPYHLMMGQNPVYVISFGGERR